MVDEEGRQRDVSSWARKFLAVSQRAWDSAACRDFAALAAALEERALLIRDFKSLEYLAADPTVRKEIAGVLQAVRKIDDEIRKALNHEMEQDSRAIRDTANRARALSAYDRVAQSSGRFDNSK